MKHNTIIWLIGLNIILFFCVFCQKHTTEPPPPESDLTPSEILRIDYKDGGFNVYWSRNNEPSFASYVLLESLGGDNWQAAYSTTDRNDTMHTIPDIPWDIYRYYRINTGDTDGLFAHGPEKRGSSHQRIVFQSNKDGNSDIYIMEIDGSNPINLTKHRAHDMYPMFFPDGSKILFLSKRNGNYDLYVMTVDGTDLTELTNTPETEEFPSISGDGTKIAFGQLSNTYIMNSDGSGRIQLTFWESGSYDYGFMFPIISSDGSQIVMQGIHRYNFWDIFKINTDGTDLRQLTLTKIDLDPKFSPDGLNILFESFRDENWEIYTMNTDGSSKTNVTNVPDWDDWAPQYSPDGSKIVYLSWVDENREVFVMDSDGGNQIRLTHTPENEWKPKFSPDGTMILYLHGERDYSSDIFIMDAYGVNQTNLTNSPANHRWFDIQPRN